MITLSKRGEIDHKGNFGIVVTTQSERQWKYRSGPFNSNRLATVDDRISCSVQPSPAAASTLHPQLTGDDLSVFCRHKGTQKGDREATYAFVRSLGSYVLLREVMEWQTTVVSIAAVR